MAKSAAMAVVIAKRLHYAAITSFTCPYVSHSRPTSRLSVPQRRTFTSTLAIQRPTPQNETRVSPEHFRAQLSEDAQVEYDSLSPEERLEVQLEAEEEDVYINQDEQQSILRTAINEEAQEVEKSYPPPERPVMRFKPGFMAMGEEDEEGTGEDDDFEEDDISTPAHAELERHREMREYARITAWEMPLLSKLAKPFVPPGRDQPLRFRYTTYLGEEHPAEKKVVLQFGVDDMPDLTQAQRDKLIKLLGPRFNPETGIVRMSCESFETQAQNKRYLGDMVEKLLTEARDPTETFADLPFDFRHHVFKVKPKFPREWMITPERRRYLEESRQKALMEDAQREAQNKLLDGADIIEHAFHPVVEMPKPELAAIVQPMVKGQGGTFSKKRTIKELARKPLWQA